jgi:DNA-binding IclR family transcriptional regulator
VGELVRWGALNRTSGGRYRLGSRLWKVAQHASPPLRDTARPFLQDLRSLTKETTHIAVRQGDDALYIDVLHSLRRTYHPSRVGGRASLHLTAAGRVLLAYEASSVRQAYLAGALDPPTGQGQPNPTRLTDELVGIRQREFATTSTARTPPGCTADHAVRQVP